MAAATRYDRQFIVKALIWATLGGAIIGGVCLALWLVLDGSAQGIYRRPWLGLVAPFIFASYSLFAVLPCTLMFGLSSALLIDNFALRKWPALAVCAVSAITAQIGCIWLFFWDDYSDVSDFLFTTPFALGAAITLWWRLTRT